jgi:hypothetical protein
MTTGPRVMLSEGPDVVDAAVDGAAELDAVVGAAELGAVVGAPELGE